MIKYIAIWVLTVLLAACSSKKADSSQMSENLKAKTLLQGVWLEDETDTPLMRVKGDTIYYADPQSSPVFFKINKVGCSIRCSQKLFYFPIL